MAVRLRLSDATTSAVLAEHYRTQTETCHQMARMAVSPFKAECLVRHRSCQNWEVVCNQVIEGR